MTLWATEETTHDHTGDTLATCRGVVSSRPRSRASFWSPPDFRRVEDFRRPAVIMPVNRRQNRVSRTDPLRIVWNCLICPSYLFFGAVSRQAVFRSKFTVFH